MSLLFIASHGDTKNTGDKAGAIKTIERDADGDVSAGDLLLGRLAETLQEVPGQVVVFLGSCGSGAGVISDEDAAKKDAKESQNAAFARAVADAFARAAEEAGEIDARTGELRNSKFRVLTAAEYHQSSWGMEGGADPHNDFTEYLVNGVLSEDGAETDSQGRITLGALYAYIQKVGDGVANEVYDEYGNTVPYYQYVQVYPEKGMPGHEDPLFVRPES